MRSHSQTLEAIHAFVERWKDRGYEKGESQLFWTELLHEVLEIERPGDVISFENQVKLASTSFIDAYIAPTKVLIEQKSMDIDLNKAIKQSDGTLLTPFQQAKRYAAELPVSKHPRWVVTCNFKKFHVYDMENPHGDPEEILLENLEKDYYRLRFLVEDGKAHLQRELEVSIKAGDHVGKLYDAFYAQYGNQVTAQDLHSLNVLCVRLVFCLYAEDAGIFSKDQFYYYMAQYKPDQMRDALKALFTTLDTPIEKRDRFLHPALKAFPYVNGSLFCQQPHEDIPPFDADMAELLLMKASLGFDWSEISPTIFGAVFESTLNPETRRAGGMHYTSIENIHKVIDPLFFNDLKAEFEQIKAEKQHNKRNQKLEAFQDKLAGLKFLDPACGSGNFLTETYISLRRLENEAISLRLKGQKLLGLEQFNPIKVNIHQFYGIEINDFAVTVAMTALWIAESQMMHETERIIKFDLDYLPLKSFTNIRCGNALRMDWGTLLGGLGPFPPTPRPNGEGDLGGGAPNFDYIMGNPPFCGRRYRTPEQIEDVAHYFDYKDIDYVACWYKKTADFIQNTQTKCAFVSTNSISQGEQVNALWNHLNVNIHFAYRTFRWDSEADIKAHVHCIIIGFSMCKTENPMIYDGERMVEAKHINGYLLNAPDIYISPRKKPLCDVPAMHNGNVPLDGDALKIEANDIHLFDNCKHFIKKLIGGRELLHNESRYVLWLVNASPNDIKKYPQIFRRVELCRENRLAMIDKETRKLADTPTVFRDTLNPKDYIAIPLVSSERRKYIPMMYFHDDTIPTNQVQIIINTSLYHFGVLNSNVHMAWTRAVCGRLKSDYRYSKDIVYNNFPWPIPTEAQKAKIEKTAQAILDARALHPDCSLAVLYDEVTMPPELRKAHQNNDRAVMEAYGFDYRTITESECVAELFKLYQKLVEAEQRQGEAKLKRARKKKTE